MSEEAMEQMRLRFRRTVMKSKAALGRVGF
jgi:hypothetical protein